MATRAVTTWRVRTTVVAAVLAGLAVIGGVTYLLLRPSADIAAIHSSFSAGFGGARAADDDGAGLRRRFTGTGTVIVAISATNTRDRDVELSVPQDALDDLDHWGIEGNVLFVPMERSRGYGDYRSEADLKRGTTTMPAHAEGEIVHVFRVTRCLPENTTMVALYALETDGHDARVEISPTSDTRELSTYEHEVQSTVGDVEMGGC
jgi:hypothetical protein